MVYTASEITKPGTFEWHLTDRTLKLSPDLALHLGFHQADLMAASILF
ncbi:MAG: hypothetical protein Q8K74_09575 [Candidatus Nitrotoga sp.]|nr:hypothetical protein [Candidatus Nitrotoga sp.]MDP1637390.1 hypothetical protein [Candidatus Nitrotoga sp.]MDP1856279.1 hypothetical protein [Candidatus Nitrotoga sp.]MDP3496215.1 hypothetical protein [Candidatus Nitrotoga sp.]